MNVSQGKTEYDPMKSKIEPFDKVHKKKKFEIFLIIIFFSLLFLLFILFFFIISYKNKIIFDLEHELHKKELEIKKIIRELSDLKKQKEKEVKQDPDSGNKIQEKKSVTEIDTQYLYDKNFYNKYNMYTDSTLNKLEYETILHTHTLEKGMEHFDIRPFAVEKITYIINLIRRQSKFENFKNKFSFINGINSLRAYKNIYEEHGWTDKKEFKKVSDFLKQYTYVEQRKAGAYILTKKELEKFYNIDYLKFIKSRHSTRNYRNKPIKLEDVKSAVEMAKYSASACNRQNIKLHFYPSGKMRENVIQYARGKSGIYLEGVNTFIVTFDVNGLRPKGERNLGYFSAGLYSTNLANAFHSLGIGTCFIQFSNSVKEEEELKKLNSIPEYERIAVIIFAGYYDEKSIFAVSSRKELKELLFVHK